MIPMGEVGSSPAKRAPSGEHWQVKRKRVRPPVPLAHSPTVVDLASEETDDGSDKGDLLIVSTRPGSSAGPNVTHSGAVATQSETSPSGRSVALWGELCEDASVHVPTRPRAHFAPPSARMRTQQHNASASQASASVHVASNTCAAATPSLLEVAAVEQNSSLASVRQAAAQRYHSAAEAAHWPQGPMQALNIPEAGPSGRRRAGPMPRDRRTFASQHQGRRPDGAQDPLPRRQGFVSAHVPMDDPAAVAMAQPCCDDDGANGDDRLLASQLQEQEDAEFARQTALQMDGEEDLRLQRRMDALEAMEEAMMRGEAGHGVISPGWRGRTGTSAGRGRSANSHWRFAALDMLGSFLPQAFRGHRRHGRSSAGGPGSHYHHRGAAGSVHSMMAGLSHSGLPSHMVLSDRDFTADDYEMLCKLDETVENRKGATQQDIDQLPTQVAVTRTSAVAAAASTALLQRLGGEQEHMAGVNSIAEGSAGGDCDGDIVDGFGRCSICLEDVAVGAVLRTLPCCHNFHKDCVDVWLKQKANCPICQRGTKT